MTEPLTPPDCDLRGLPYMPLHGDRLMESALFFKSTGDEFKAALALWWASWKQVPAASLEDDEACLAGHARVHDPKKWAKVKAMALRGWIKCSDGRLYHPVVAEMALEAWEDRQDLRAGKAAEKERKQRERAERRDMFVALKGLGVHLAWNIPTADLRTRYTKETNLSQDQSRHLSRGQVEDCPPPDTAIEEKGSEEEGILSRVEGASAIDIVADWPDGSTPQWAGKLTAAAGPGLADPAKEPGLFQTAPEVSQWRSWGCSWEIDVLPVVMAQTLRPRTDPIRTWTYFTEAIRKARDLRLQPVPPVQLYSVNDHERSDNRPKKLDAKLSNMASCDAGAELASDIIRHRRSL